MPQLRQNIITGEWVVIAPERAKRPNEFVVAHQPRTDAKQDCPFCIEGAAYPTRLKGFETDHVYVIPNKFPAFVEDPKDCSDRSYKVEDDFYLAKQSLGGHDVLVIKDHDLTLADFSREVWRDLLFMIRRRYRHFDTICNNHATMAIYNEKSQAGASIQHPHAQIFSSNIVPNLISRELDETSRYYQDNGRSAFDELIRHEQTFKHRILHENDYYLAFTQFAARFPFETWIVPKFQRSRFDKVTDRQLAALVPTIMSVLGKLNRTLQDPPLNIFWHSAPNSIEEIGSYRWHIEIAPRLATYGGFELGSGVVIDVVSPELAADYLNGKKSATN